MVVSILLRVIPSAGTKTVTVHVSVRPPFTDVAVITAVPAETAVTVPSVSTVATAGLLLDQVTEGSVALEGEISAVSFSVPPLAMDVLILFSEMPVTG